MSNGIEQLIEVIKEFKDLTGRIVRDLGEEVRESPKVKPGQVWKLTDDSVYILTFCSGKYRTANVKSGCSYYRQRDTPDRAVKGLTFVADSLEDFLN